MKKRLVLRTCKPDMTGYGGFKWPERGPVKAPDWNPIQACGQGLHGLLNGVGDTWLLSYHPDAKWLVVEVNESQIIDLDGKVKFPRGVVVHTGNQKSATDYLIAHGCDPYRVVGAHLKCGDDEAVFGVARNVISAGNRAVIGTGKHSTITAGYYCVVSAGFSAKVSVGYSSRVTVGEESEVTALAVSTVIGGHRCTVRCDYGSEVICGIGSQVSAGLNSTIAIYYLDDKFVRKLCVGIVDGKKIKPDVFYEVRNGKFVKVKSRKNKLDKQ
jgi:hypothetical protein